MSMCWPSQLGAHQNSSIGIGGASGNLGSVPPLIHAGFRPTNCCLYRSPATNDAVYKMQDVDGLPVTVLVTGT